MTEKKISYVKQEHPLKRHAISTNIIAKRHFKSFKEMTINIHKVVG